MAKASRRGCIIFWLPNESKTNPRIDGNPYGRDSYGELGEWRSSMMYDRSLRVVVGGEKEFSGLDVIKANFDAALKMDFPIHPSLEETVKTAVRVAW